MGSARQAEYAVAEILRVNQGKNSILLDSIFRGTERYGI